MDSGQEYRDQIRGLSFLLRDPRQGGTVTRVGGPDRVLPPGHHLVRGRLRAPLRIPADLARQFGLAPIVEAAQFADRVADNPAHRRVCEFHVSPRTILLLASSK